MLINMKNWDQYVASAETVARSSGFRALGERIITAAHLDPSHTVLDVGSGTGLLTLPAARVSDTVWALDISERMGDYLSAKAQSAGLGNVETVTASAVSLPLVDSTVDVVISNYCFHHLASEQKLVALEEVNRVLTPGGRVVIGDMMFSLGLAEARNRRVVSAKVRTMLSKGPAGAWRLARNGGRYLTGRWEQPATPAWWHDALERAGFDEVRVEALDHEGGIASARKPQA